MSRSLKYLVVAGAVAVATACTSAPMMSRQQLLAALGQCTRTHGYDPRQTAGVAENALAPNELPWRQCAYDAVRAYAKGRSSLADLYAQLISEDIAMTTAIQQGNLTRSQRRARIEALLAEIRSAEDFQIQAADTQGSGGQNPSRSHQDREQLSNVVEGMRGLY